MTNKVIFSIALGAFVLQLINIIVFFSMNDYISQSNQLIDYFMYYLSFVLIIVSFIINFMMYHLRSVLTKAKKIIVSITFYVMLTNVLIFVATYIFLLRQ